MTSFLSIDFGVTIISGLNLIFQMINYTGRVQHPSILFLPNITKHRLKNLKDFCKREAYGTYFGMFGAERSLNWNRFSAK